VHSCTLAVGPGAAGLEPAHIGSRYATVWRMAQVIEGDALVGEVLASAAEFFRDYLWTSEIGASVLSRIAREGVEGETVRAFGVGYAPGEHRLVLEHLAKRGYSAAALDAAGIATRSRRGRVHPHFRSRVMFPIRDRNGTLLGFAGMATNPGPSWPLWLTSPDRGRFQRRAAIFAIDRAAAAIGEAGRAVVINDCLDVLRLHQGGRCEAVAVIRSPITGRHAAQLAAEFGVPADAVRVERRQGTAGAVITPVPSSSTGAQPIGAEDANKDRVRASDSQRRPDPIKTRSPPARAFLQLSRGALGVGIPLAWVAIVQPDPDAPGGADAAFVGALGAVAATYMVLALVAAIAAARYRARSRARRMRAAWERGLTEWQPIAWTYHMLEDILIGAALVSIVVCTALFLMIGGFTS
jgi:DNA primase-like protein